MTAAERLIALESLDAESLCARSSRHVHTPCNPACLVSLGRCWAQHPEDRPGFEAIATKLEKSYAACGGQRVPAYAYHGV